MSAPSADYSEPGKKTLTSFPRPSWLGDFIGQRHLKANLRVFVTAALRRGEALDHILLTGFPGSGKTTLANIIAHEMGARLHCPTAVKRPKDLTAFITQLEEGDILFIKDIHRLPSEVEKKLYPVLEDNQYQLILGQGAAAREVSIELPRFTLIGDTTNIGLVSSRLRQRFGILLNLDQYQSEDLQLIIERSASFFGILIDSAAAREIARNARGSPKRAYWLLRRVRDYAEVESEGHLTEALVSAALSKIELDP